MLLRIIKSGIQFMANELQSREISFFIIKKVLEEGATLERSIETILGSSSERLSDQDRRFIRHITTTVIRRLGQLDKIINYCTKTKLGNTQMQIRYVLRLGIAQLLYSEVPAHAAVNTSVNLIVKIIPKKLHYLKNTVNAILRKVDREKDFFLKKYNNTRLNLPPWLLKSWDSNYGQTQVKLIIDTILSEAPLDISIKPKNDPAEWAEKLGGKVVPGGSIRIFKSGKVTELKGYMDGEWWVQDMAARIPANLLGAKEQDHVLDLCAAPGGKTAQSAAIGATVTAVDVSKSRLKRLKENMDRLNLNVNMVLSDVLNYSSDQKYDFILLDAPCSSTGTIRRHPEILHTRTESDVAQLTVIQSKMLDHASSLLNKGGILVYSVCSMQAEEGVKQIKALLERDGSLQRKRIMKSEMPEFEQAILDTGDVQTLPHYYGGGMDGFFVSRLIKN